MAKVAILLADGFEEIEGITVIDILRRAKIDVTMAGLHDGIITGAHGIKITPDTEIYTIEPGNYDMLFLPGGQPGADNLNNEERVKVLINDFYDSGKLVGAICAAPYVLGQAGILKGKHATSYPGYLEQMGEGVMYEEEKVVVDGTIITSRGPGTAAYVAFAIVKKLVGPEIANKLKTGMLYP